MALKLLEPTVETVGEYRLRPATFDDLEGALAAFNAYSQKFFGCNEFDPQNYLPEWQMPGFNVATDVRVVAAPDGQIVAAMEAWDLMANHVRVDLFGRVHPEHQGKGVGAALLKWGEARARQAVDRAPAEARVAVHISASERDAAATQLFQQQGFASIRRSWRMAIDLDAPPPAPEWPDGIAVRPMRLGVDNRAVVQAVRDSFQDHWGYVVQPFEEEFERWEHIIRTDSLFDPALWFLAMDGDAVAGISLCWTRANSDPDMGWVGTLGVLRPYRRHGLGLALLRHSFAEFYQRGRKRVGLGVDAQSLTGATRLYERAGMKVTRVHNRFEKVLRPGVELSTQSVEA